MPEHEELSRRVLDVCEEELGRVCQLDTDLIQTFGMDSLDHVELVMAIETAFDLDIPDEDLLQAWRTPQAIVDYLVGRGLEVTGG